MYMCMYKINHIQYAYLGQRSIIDLVFFDFQKIVSMSVLNAECSILFNDSHHKTCYIQEDCD